MRVVRALAAGAAPLLAGCDGLPGADLLAGDGDPPPCPHVRVIGDADRWARFADDGPVDPENIAVAARIAGVEAACAYDEADDPAGGMTLSIGVLMDAERAPDAAAAPGEAAPWFVAVVGPDRQLTNKSAFEAAFVFDDPDSRVARIAPQEVELRFPPGADRSPWEYEVLIGFQLDRDQLEYLRGLRQ